MYVLSFFKKGDTIQGGTLFKGGHYLRKYGIYLLLNDNPEGCFFICSYEYSHAKDRLWRKTRSKHRGRGCVGVDPNRNWGYHWAGKGASGDPCDETFYGPHAFSEPETDAIQKFIMARQGNWDVS